MLSLMAVLLPQITKLSAYSFGIHTYHTGPQREADLGIAIHHCIRELRICIPEPAKCRKAVQRKKMHARSNSTLCQLLDDVVSADLPPFRLKEIEAIKRFVANGGGLFVIGAVRAACAAGLGARAQRFVDDGLDGAGTAAAFGAATEAAIDLLRMAHGIAAPNPPFPISRSR